MNNKLKLLRKTISLKKSNCKSTQLFIFFNYYIYAIFFNLHTIEYQTIDKNIIFFSAFYFFVLISYFIKLAAILTDATKLKILQK